MLVTCNEHFLCFVYLRSVTAFGLEGKFRNEKLSQCHSLFAAMILEWMKCTLHVQRGNALAWPAAWRVSGLDLVCELLAADLYRLFSLVAEYRKTWKYVLLV